MINEGDRIAVGVSGGKDSVALLWGLILLRRFLGINFSIVAITLDIRVERKAGDFSAIKKICEENSVEFVLKETDLWEIIFDVRKEKNPCSLCARMRRGLLHDTAKEYSCNKIALGHHRDDAVETFFMNLFNEGRIGCFSPVSYLSRKDLYMIRPLIFTEEKDILRAIEKENLPVVKSRCPADGKTDREATKNFVAERVSLNPFFKDNIIGAMIRGNISGWGKENEKDN
jgi:tRNA(Ile)-lysidine synthetase-like protein